MVVATAPILQKHRLAPRIFAYLLHCPEVAALAVAGQFLHVKAPGFLLRRPISISHINRQAGTLTLVVEVRGPGTTALSQLEEGQTMDFLGPCGHGFELLLSPAKAVIVGGGIGTPPLLELGAHYGGRADVFLGFRTAEMAILAENFAALGCRVQIATDDGSRGHHGMVTDLLAQHLNINLPDVIYGCGPKPMLAAVAQLAARHGVRCQVSLEERMACGIGACLGCAFRMTQKDQNGAPIYHHVCKRGPVFEACDVDLTFDL